jgi:hypothetical protein
VPEVANASPSLDDNPDANAGSTTFGATSLGASWDCSVGGEHPTGDVDVNNGTGVADSGQCASTAGPNTLTSGVLGVITMTKAPAACCIDLPITLQAAVVTGEDTNEIGSCNPTVTVAMTCQGATLRVVNCDNSFASNSDGEPRFVGGPNIPGDATWPRHDRIIDECDLDDDNDGLTDEQETSGSACTGIMTTTFDLDSDNDSLIDGWECATLLDGDMGNDSYPNDAASRKPGASGGDADGDRVLNGWEQRGYNSRIDSTDSDGDGCHDLVEVASVDTNRAVTDADRLAVARRALGIWAPHAGQDWLLDINKNGVVEDSDRLFAARAALLPDWQPKLC